MQVTAQQWLVVLLAAPNVTLAQAAAGSGIGADAEARANQYLGIIATASALPVLLVSVYGGMVADRYPKRGVILVTQACQMLLAFALAGLLFGGHVAVWHVVLLAGLAGLVNAFDVPARQAFVVEMVGKEDLGNAIALNSGIFNAARTVGPALAGVLIAVLSRLGTTTALAQCFLLNGLSFLAVIAGLLAMHGGGIATRATAPAAEGRLRPREQIAEVVRYLRTHRAALLLVLLVATTSVLSVPYFVLLPSLARFTLGVDARGFGLLLSCQGIGATIGALSVASRGEAASRGRVLCAASVGFSALLLLLALSRSYPVSCVLVGLIGFGTISFLATANGLLQTSVPDGLRGRMMAVYAMILMGMTPVGSLWAGWVARWGGAPLAIGLGAALSLAAALFVTLRYPAFRQMGQALPERLG